MADAFAAVRLRAAEAAKSGAQDHSASLRMLGAKERQLLVFFKKQNTATADEIAAHLRLSHRTIVGLCRAWVKSGFLQLANPSRKARSYGLGDDFAKMLN